MNRSKLAIFSALLILTLTSVPQVEAQGLPFAKAGPDAALITGRLGKPGSDLYAVQFIEIDGRNIAGDRDYIWMTPGRYTIKVRMLIDNPPGLNFRRPEQKFVDDYNVIELDLEAGKSYRILGQYDEARTHAPYQTILYQVTENN